MSQKALTTYTLANFYFYVTHSSEADYLAISLFQSNTKEALWYNVHQIIYESIEPQP